MGLAFGSGFAAGLASFGAAGVADSFFSVDFAPLGGSAFFSAGFSAAGFGGAADGFGAAAAGAAGAASSALFFLETL